MPEKIIGILGGMGPEATIDLYTKIVKGTKVKRDQDHLRILVDNNPKIPDRTLAIKKKGPSPLPQLIRSAKILEKAGADFIIIPCVTAHHYFKPLQERIRIPILHLIEISVQYLKTKWKRISKVGLLATTGTIQTGLFQKAFSHTGIEVVVPDPEIQEYWVMEAIYGKQGIKVMGPSENSKRLILKASERLVRLGAQAIIAGCTEVPLVLKEGDLLVPVIDPISILAKTAIEKARGRKKSE
jgi:aspartate racemase